MGSGQRTVTQEILMTAMDISGVGYKLTLKSTASRKFPKQFFTKMAAAVLDSDTGQLLEFRHLMKNPKYKEIWGNLFEMKLGVSRRVCPVEFQRKRQLLPCSFLSRTRYPAIGREM